jgi:hypothetical protein
MITIPNPIFFEDPDGMWPDWSALAEGFKQGFVNNYKSIAKLVTTNPITTAKSITLKGAVEFAVYTTTFGLSGIVKQNVHLAKAVARGDTKEVGKVFGDASANVTTAVAIGATGKILSMGVKALRGVGTAAADAESSLVAVRHHTSAEGLSAIKESGTINASRGEPFGVDVEIQPFMKPSEVKLGQAGTGAYVEFSVPASDVGPPADGFLGGTGNAGRIATGGAPLNIQNAIPKFVIWKWW